MVTHAYAEPPQPAPTECPCLTCHAHGPYCADSCAQFEAWEKAGRPGPTAVTVKEATA
jgi:hypothetical protein